MLRQNREIAFSVLYPKKYKISPQAMPFLLTHTYILVVTILKIELKLFCGIVYFDKL